MTGAIERYTKRVTDLLRGTSYRPVPTAIGGTDCYGTLAGAPTPGPDVPFVACNIISWGADMDKEKEAWDQMIKNHKISLAITHPTASIISMQGPPDVGRGFPLIMAQNYAKLRRSIRGNLAFFDVDIVAYNPCDPFDEDFDIGLTDCDDLWPMQPFNAGVQFVKDTPGAQKYLDMVMEMTFAIPGNMDPWYCQQISMGTVYHMLKNEVKFAIFPHEKYNFTPAGLSFEETDAYFVHARGPRKNLHYEYTKRLVERSGYATESA